MTTNATARLPAHRVHDGGLSAVRASNRAGTCIAHDEKCNVNASVSSVTAWRDSTESLSGGNPGEKSVCHPADHRGFVVARSTPSTHSDSKSEMAGEPGAIQRVAGNAEGKTRDSADRRSPDGPIEHAVAGRE